METDLTYNLDSNDEHVCQNCGSKWTTDKLKPIQDLHERIAPGEIVPSGECPDCGALCHWMRESDPDKPLELRLCETEHTVLQPDRLYRFTVDPDCTSCVGLAKVYDPNYPLQHKAIKVIIRHDPDSPRPEVKLEPNLPFVVDFQETDESDFFFKHSGIRIFHTEWKNEVFSEHWFSNESGQESDSAYTFDVRDIPVPDDVDLAKEYPEYDKDQQAIAYAIDQGWIMQDDIEIPES